MCVCVSSILIQFLIVFEVDVTNFIFSLENIFMIVVLIELLLRARFYQNYLLFSFYSVNSVSFSCSKYEVI